MSIGTAQKIIQEAFSTIHELDEIEIDFHGGEIALKFDIVKEICQWLWGEKRPNPYLCYASTNGTLIHDNIQSWFYQHRDKFWLGLSLDGTPEMHNANRSNSFEQIDIDFFRSSWPEQSTKMTISQETLPFLADGVKYIHKLGFRINANLAFGIDWGNKYFLNSYADQLYSLVEFYLDNPAIELSSLFSFSLAKVGAIVIAPEKIDAKKWCGCGETMVCYDMGGNRYPCQMFLPSTSAKNGFNILNTIDFQNFQNFIDPICTDCILNSACATCYGHNYFERGAINIRDKRLCGARKLEALAASYLYGNMLLNKLKYKDRLPFSQFEEAFVVAGIKAVQNRL